MLNGKLTIIFENPFWVGIFERETEAGFSAARWIFEKEPSDVEVYTFVLQHLKALRYSDPVPQKPESQKPNNYKRRMREAQNFISQDGVDQKAIEAIQSQKKKNRQIQKSIKKAEHEQLEHHRMMVRQKRKKEKHKGR